MDSQIERRVPVGPGTRVELRFTLRLSNQQIIDSTGKNSATFIVGDGNLMPGFERAMFGLHAGDSRRLAIKPEHGFGLSNPENVQLMRRDRFGDEIEVAEGLVVSFASRQEQEVPGVITRVTDDEVEVDFNHPLAGEEILFEVEILQVTQVSNEIIRV